MIRHSDKHKREDTTKLKRKRDTTIYQPSNLDNSLLQPNLQPERLPQETLSGLHRVVLLQLELEQPEDSANSKQKLHLSKVTTNASTGASTEGDEGSLLAGGETLGVPAFGNELVGFGAPDFWVTVDGVAGNGDNVAGVEDVAGDVDGAAVRRDLAGETHGGGAMDTHGFPDDPLKAALQR